MWPARPEPLSIWLQGPTSAGAGPERSTTSHADVLCPRSASSPHAARPPPGVCCTLPSSPQLVSELQAPRLHLPPRSPSLVAQGPLSSVFPKPECPPPPAGRSPKPSVLSLPGSPASPRGTPVTWLPRTDGSEASSSLLVPRAARTFTPGASLRSLRCPPSPPPAATASPRPPRAPRVAPANLAA